MHHIHTAWNKKDMKSKFIDIDNFQWFSLYSLSMVFMPSGETVIFKWSYTKGS
jgi:hypothetical protein